ncbi:MAG: glycoside hydrolase family 3 N-terminal domain-containing protein, partial [Curtobacterium sp.]
MTPEDAALEADAALLSGEDFWLTRAGDRVRAMVLIDGPHGVRLQRDAADHLGVNSSEPATCFPPATGLGSSWDRGLAAEVAQAIGREAREQGADVLLGPGVNIKRSPLGGRNFEYLSEDPLLSGALG